jgi:hypothetical protein
VLYREGAKDALDNLYNPAVFVGFGAGNILHRRRADSHPAGYCLGRNGNPPDPGTQGSWLEDPRDRLHVLLSLRLKTILTLWD